MRPQSRNEQQGSGIRESERRVKRWHHLQEACFCCKRRLVCQRVRQVVEEAAQVLASAMAYPSLTTQSAAQATGWDSVACPSGAFPPPQFLAWLPNFPFPNSFA